MEGMGGAGTPDCGKADGLAGSMFESDDAEMGADTEVAGLPYGDDGASVGAKPPDPKPGTLGFATGSAAPAGPSPKPGS